MAPFGRRRSLGQTAPALIEAAKPAIARRGLSLKRIARKPAERDLDVDHAWIADIFDAGGLIRRPVS